MQLPTFANLLSTSLAIQQVVDKEGSISNGEASRIIREMGMGLDEWGSPIIFRARKEPGFSFILISLGRDKSLDVDDIGQYFTHPQENIVGEFDRDIVFRDGKPVTIASAK